MAHDKPVWVVEVFAILELFVNGIKLVNNPDCFKLLGLLVPCLSSKYQNPILVPRKMDRNQFAHERELLIGLQINSVPSIAFNRESFNGVQAFGEVFRLLLRHELVIHASKDKDEFVVPSTATKIVSWFIHLCNELPLGSDVLIEHIVTHLH